LPNARNLPLELLNNYPLHKKGDKQNPDNYRAITVGSCLGKLFASLLLERLIDFRKVICPDGLPTVAPKRIQFPHINRVPNQ
jgi:hypothetical protein